MAAFNIVKWWTSVQLIVMLILLTNITRTVLSWFEFSAFIDTALEGYVYKAV